MNKQSEHEHEHNNTRTSNTNKSQTKCRTRSELNAEQNTEHEHPFSERRTPFIASPVANQIQVCLMNVSKETAKIITYLRNMGARGPKDVQGREPGGCDSALHLRQAADGSVDPVALGMRVGGG